MLKDNRLKSAFKLMFGSEILIYIPGFLKNQSLGFEDDSSECIQFDEATSNFSLDESQNKAIVVLTSRRFSAVTAILEKKKYDLVDEYIVIPSFQNPRWIVSANSHDLGEMIQASSLKARIAILVFKAFLKIKLGGIVFPHKLRRYSAKTNISKITQPEIFDVIPKGVSYRVVYLGSFGPLQKITFEFVQAGVTTMYAKIGDNNRSKKSLINEKSALEFINTLRLENLFVPKLISSTISTIHEFSILQQSALLGGMPSKVFSTNIASTLIELHKKTLNTNEREFNQVLSHLGDSLGSKECELNNLTGVPKNALLTAVTVCEFLLKNFNKESVAISYSHGDFTRWNIREDLQYNYVFDWEEAKFRPIGHDFFHYILIDSILVNNELSAASYYNKIKQLLNLHQNLYGILFCKEMTLVIYYLRCYLLDMVNTYLWHAMIHSSEGYPEKQNINQILLFICNLFDYLDEISDDK